MIKLRRKHRALVYGSFELLARENGRLFAFIREEKESASSSR